MKIQKGEAGYIQSRKKKLVIITIVSFAWVLAVLLIGYLINKTKSNIFTIIAILGCIPASMSLVNLIMMIPHKSINEHKKAEIEGCSDNLIILYDLVVTSEKKAMPIEAVAVSENTICGYTRNEKMDLNYCGKYIKSILEQNHYEKITVKIFRDYVAFLSRVEGMNNIASVENHVAGRKEKEMATILTEISL